MPNHKAPSYYIICSYYILVQRIFFRDLLLLCQDAYSLGLRHNLLHVRAMSTSPAVKEYKVVQPIIASLLSMTELVLKAGYFFYSTQMLPLHQGLKNIDTIRS